MSATRLRHPAAPWLAVALLLVLGSCGDDGSTELGAPPTELVALSPLQDTVVTGEDSDPPLAVRVQDPLGDPVEGIPVRFLLASGEGELFPSLAVSNREGIAESTFRAGMAPGESRIRADIPSASDVRALEFTILTEPSAVVALAAAGGLDQRAEVGTQLPLPFEARARTPGGSPAGGIAVAWRVVEGGGRLTTDTAFTDAEGHAETLLTLGPRAGDVVVAAHAARGVASDTLRFRVTATSDFEGAARLDSVRPSPLRAGEEALVFGKGLGGSEVEVRLEGEPVELLEAEAGHLRVRVPTFLDRCRPARDVGVRALVDGEASSGIMERLLPAQEVLALAPGESRTLLGAGEVSCIQLDSASVPREYQVTVHSASRTAGSVTALRLFTAVSGGGRLQGGDFAEADRSELPAGTKELAERSASAELRLRASAFRELERRRAAPVRRAVTDTSVLAARAASEPPAVGDTLIYRFAVGEDLTASCADTTRRVRAVVRAAGPAMVLAEDVEAPRPGLPEEAWGRLSAELNDVVYPTDTSYFGPTADIDGNGRVVALFTPQVNRLTPRGSETGIGGFFLPLDLAASGRGGEGVPGPGGEACPASNEAEILYVAAADPEGAAGEPISVPRALRNARGIVAHELQHLINAQTRVLARDGGFGAREEVWLDEGLSHLAEEVAGLRLLGLQPGGNLAYEAVTRTREALDIFNAFHINNFFQLGLYMLGPQVAPVLAPADPGGLGGLQMRGFGWFFLRWLADQEGGADERQLTRRLVWGGQGPQRGVANVEQAVGRAWEGLLSDFAVALALDDAGLDALSARHRVTTWDFRDVFRELNRSPTAGGRFPLPFPLDVTPLGFRDAALEFEVGASTVRYFRLAGASETPALALGAAGPGGASLSATARPQITIVRIR